MGVKAKADPVFFISLVGVDQHGRVDDHEHIFDIYTKSYDFLGHDVKVISAQDLRNFYEANYEGDDREGARIPNCYSLADFFVHQHPNGHYFFDECPFVRSERK